MGEQNIIIPVSEKLNLTIEEAAAYSNIGTSRLHELTREPDCPFVLRVGRKKLVKRKEFEDWLKDITRLP